MLNSRSESPKVGPLSSGIHIAAIVLMRFKCHDILHQRFAHTRPWPRSQRFSPVARNSRTASDKRCMRKLGNRATSAFYIVRYIHISTVGLASTKHGRSDDASSRWHLSSHPWIVEPPVKHLLCATVHSGTWAASTRGRLPVELMVCSKRCLISTTCSVQTSILMTL